MEYSWRFLHCPKCNRTYNWHIDKILFRFKATTGLGPQNIKCSSCNTVFISGLLEWKQMIAIDKFRYIGLSVLYSLFLGFSLFMIMGAIISVFQNYTNLLAPSISNFNLKLFLVCITPIIILQFLRVLMSNTRFESVQQAPMIISFWNWQTNLQFYGMALAFLNSALGAIIYVFLL